MENLVPNSGKGFRKDFTSLKLTYSNFRRTAKFLVWVNAFNLGPTRFKIVEPEAGDEIFVCCLFVNAQPERVVSFSFPT